MEEQIGYAKVISDPISKLDATFDRLDATFDKLDEQLALFKSTLQSFIKVRFDIDINFDALIESSATSAAQDQSDAEAHSVFDEMSRTTSFSVIEDQRSLVDVDGENKDDIDGATGQLYICNPELQCDFSQVSLEDQAANMFDEMSTSVSHVVMKDQHALVPSEEENKDEIDEEEDQFLSGDPELRCDSSINLEEVNPQHDAIYSLLEDGLYLVVRDAHHSLFESNYANEIEILSINHEVKKIEMNMCLLEAFDNVGIPESQFRSILILSNENGLVHEYQYDNMSLGGQIQGSHNFDSFSFDDGFKFLFDPGGDANLKVAHAVKLVLRKESMVLLVEQNSGAEISLVTTPLGRFDPPDFQQVTIVVHGNSTLHYNVEMVSVVEGKDYCDINSQEKIQDTGQSKKKSVWFGEHTEPVNELKVRCRFKEDILEIHIKVQTSGYLKLNGYNLQLITNVSKFGTKSMVTSALLVAADVFHIISIHTINSSCLDGDPALCCATATGVGVHVKVDNLLIDAKGNNPIDLLILSLKYLNHSRRQPVQNLLNRPTRDVDRRCSSQLYQGTFQDAKVLVVKTLEPSTYVSEQFILEIERLTNLDHKNFISLFGLCSNKDYLMFLCYLLSSGSLENNLHGAQRSRQVLCWKKRYEIALAELPWRWPNVYSIVTEVIIYTDGLLTTWL